MCCSACHDRGPRLSKQPWVLLYTPLQLQQYSRFQDSYLSIMYAEATETAMPVTGQVASPSCEEVAIFLTKPGCSEWYYFRWAIKFSTTKKSKTKWKNITQSVTHSSVWAIVRAYTLHCMGESFLSVKESSNTCNIGLSGNFTIHLNSSPIFLYFVQISTADFLWKYFLQSR